jgi:predicted nucleic-acid-binding protein
MIALDTNVIVRYVVGDDLVQARLAEDVFARLKEEEPGFICRETLLELVWVLGHTYGYPRSAIGQVLEGLLSATELEIEDADALGAILHYYVDRSFDFADLMIHQVSLRRGASPVLTFDRKAARFEGVELIDGGTEADERP